MTNFIKFDVKVCSLSGGKVEIVQEELINSKTLFKYVGGTDNGCSEGITLMADSYQILIVVLIPLNPSGNSIPKRNNQQSEFPPDSALTLEINYQSIYFSKDYKHLDDHKLADEFYYKPNHIFTRTLK